MVFSLLIEIGASDSAFNADTVRLTNVCIIGGPNKKARRTKARQEGSKARQGKVKNPSREIRRLLSDDAKFQFKQLTSVCTICHAFSYTLVSLKSTRS